MHDRLAQAISEKSARVGIIGLGYVGLPLARAFISSGFNVLGFDVDQAILNEEDRVVIIRFGHDHNPTCMRMDEVLYGISEDIKNFATIYLVDSTELPDFTTM